MRLGLVLFLCFVVAGCQYWKHPSPMPTGYAYHGPEYRSVPAPEVQEIHYPYSAVSNEAHLARWRIESFELVEMLKSTLALAPQPVFIEPPKIENVFYNSLDHTLRGAFKDAGFKPVGEPEKAELHLNYTVQSKDDFLERFVIRLNEESTTHKDDPPYKPQSENAEDTFMVFFELVLNGQKIAAISDMRELPAHDYVTSYKGLRLFEPVAGGQRE